MITPLMHIFSCLTDEYTITGPVDTLYLGKQDRELIISEAKRLCSMVTDEDTIFCAASDTGKYMVCTTQNIAGTAKALSPYTALLLTRLKECVPTYLREVDTVAVEVADDDLSTDAVVLRLEGNPSYIYFYVYSIMKTPSLSYDAKIGRLRELLLTVQSHVVVQTANFGDDVGGSAQKRNLLSRLENQAKLSYWEGMLLQDYIRYYGVTPENFLGEVIDTVKQELWDLGFYGFVNPLEMYLTFNNSRVTRKVEVDIEEWVVSFLTKIILSGGTTIE